MSPQEEALSEAIRAWAAWHRKNRQFDANHVVVNPEWSAIVELRSVPKKGLHRTRGTKE